MEPFSVTIPEFYKDKTIFITGGTGFLGKVLIEKLLRSCPDINKIYVLMRPKKGKGLDERNKDIMDLPLFEVLAKQNPDAFKKLHLVDGDTSQLKLGLSRQDRARLISETQIVFHMAASVRFDDPLSKAVITNTRGTRELVELALEMNNIKVLVYVSTSYCNAHQGTVLEEKLYPANADWRKTIQIAEESDGSMLNALTKKYIEPLPNTYTFAKLLAEHVVYDLCNGELPVVIFRPTIVISTAKEPFPGWIDNFNGPVGMIVGAAKGVMRIAYSDPDVIADHIPVDIVVKALIISGWKQALMNERLKVTFYHGSNNHERPITIADIVELGKMFRDELSLSNILWYPSNEVPTKNFCVYYVKFVLYHILPALLVDGLFKITGHTPMLMKLQRRVYLANMAVGYFLTKEWKFINNNARNLEKDLLSSDCESFGYHTDELTVFDYFFNALKGGRKYLLKEDDSSLEQAKRNSRRMWFLSQFVNLLWGCGVFWLLFVKIDVISIVADKIFGNYWRQ